jgi:hypothetical protein
MTGWHYIHHRRAGSALWSYSGPFSSHESAEQYALKLVEREDCAPAIRFLTKTQYEEEMKPRLKHVWDIDEKEQRAVCRTCGRRCALETFRASTTVDMGDCPGQQK